MSANNDFLNMFRKFSVNPNAAAQAAQSIAAQAAASANAAADAANNARSLANILQSMSMGSKGAKGKRRTRKANTHMSTVGTRMSLRGQPVKHGVGNLNAFIASLRAQKKQEREQRGMPVNGPKLSLKQKAALKKQQNEEARAAASRAQVNAFKQSMAAQQAEMGPATGFAPNIPVHSHLLAKAMATNWSHAPSHYGKKTYHKKRTMKKPY